PKATRDEMPHNTIIIKEQHNPPASQNNAISGWTTMVRDGKAVWDGWYWSFHAPGGTPASGSMSDTSFPDSGFGNYCVNCHASADNSSVTYIDKRNIDGTPMTYFVLDPSMADPSLEPKHNVDLHARHAAEAQPHAAAAAPP